MADTATALTLDDKLRAARRASIALTTASTKQKDAGLEAIADSYMEVNAWGTPEQIIAKLERRKQVIGDFNLNACFRMAGIPYEDAVHSQRLFAEKVIPALR